LINPVATLIAIVISYSVFFMLQRRELQRTWGDVRSGIWIAMARYALFNLENETWHAKNWRPNIIVFTGQPHQREQLVEVSDWLSLGHGIVTFFQFIIGHRDSNQEFSLRDTERKHIRSYIEAHGMKAFAEAEVVDNFLEGALTIAQAHGIGRLEPNAILMGWSSTADGRSTQLILMRELVYLRKSVMFLNYNFERGFGEYKIIKVWWQGQGGNADLMILLAHLILRHPKWRNANIQLVRVVNHSEALESTRTHMMKLIKDARVQAEPLIIVRKSPDQPLTEIIQESGKDTDLTLIGMRVSDESETQAYGDRLNNLVQVVGSVLLVRNGEPEEDLLTAE
jgi:hypothetical protein